MEWIIGLIALRYGIKFLGKLLRKIFMFILFIFLLFLLTLYVALSS